MIINIILSQEVYGEIFEVDEKMLQHLDILEDAPNLYLRQTRKCRLVNGGSASEHDCAMDEEDVVDCEVYVMQGFKKSLLDLPFQSHYSSYAAAGKQEAGKQYDLRIDTGVSDYDVTGDIKEQ